MGRLFLVSGIAAMALVVPANTGAAPILGYGTGTAAPCTTTDAQPPSPKRPGAADNKWWMGAPQSQMTTRTPSSQSPNDFPTLQTFPTVYTQPADKATRTKITLPVSTCPNA